MYIAHINENGNRQTVKEHSENVAKMCRDFSVFELKDLMYIMGLLHDVGKYQNSFQERINGKNISVEHSICGAQVADNKFNNAVSLIMELCIAGHHSGIPNCGVSQVDSYDMPTLYGRLKRQKEDFSAYENELKIPSLNEKEICEYICCNCKTMDELIDKFAFLVRYCFSCLTDADSLDTSEFCNGVDNRSLIADFEMCLENVNSKLNSFKNETNLQMARSVLQSQVFSKVDENAEIFLINMPTGSGKTLCSIKFALERAIKLHKKRIIYIIPYNSIIEQTATEFEKIFGQYAEILRHQSTFCYDDITDKDEDYSKTFKLATENWDAKLIITTSVQFFESIYSNKRGKLRKLHNMADSILIFDEAHLMPIKYLKPCLQSISYITRYLNSEAVLLTATMPNYKDLMNKYSFPDSKILNLVDDDSEFVKFNKCDYENVSMQSDESIISKASNFASSLIVVNSRATAKRLYSISSGKKYHLSTYMTSFDRNRVIEEIKLELIKLENDFPELENVPDERRVIVISTSLIEAGVDLDFCSVFRELTGLDSILQSGGRCNREGKRKNAKTYIFELGSEQGKPSKDERKNITKGLLNTFENIASRECIANYYEKLFFAKENIIERESISYNSTDVQNLDFKDYSQQFEIIDSNTVSVVVERDETSHNLIKSIMTDGFSDSRKLQKYAFSIYQKEFDNLFKQGVVDDFGSGIWCLTNTDYYNLETGVLFESKDYYI